MRNIILLKFIIFFLIFYSCTEKNISKKISVGVFSGFGATPHCVSDAVEALRIDKDISANIITADDILNGKLSFFDALVFPGGSGSKQMSNMGSLVVKHVENFVRVDGKVVLGICAGAYLLSNTPNYTCIKLANVQAIDREHDARGHGLVEFSLNTIGKKLFPELSNLPKCFMQYYEGPILVPNDESKKFTVFGNMVSDVHLQNNAPANLTNGKPVLLYNESGNGKVFLSVCHPEATEGMRWMIPRIIRFLLNKPLIKYPNSVVNPGQYTKEILFNNELLSKEAKLKENIIFGDSTKKIEAIKELVLIHSWQAKKIIVGLIRENDSAVRIKAAKALVKLEHTKVIDEIETIYKIEPNKSVKQELKTCIEELTEMISR